MSVLNDFLTYPVDSTPPTLPALASDPNYILAPDLSQINYLFFTPCTAADPFENDGSDNISVVALSIDNTNADNTKTRQILGEGGIPEHAASEVEGPNGTTLIPEGERQYTFTHRVIISDPLMYEFLRQLQVSWIGWRFWFQDRGGWLYGKVEPALATVYGGIRPSFINVQFPKGNGRSDRGYADIEIRWNANGDPHRYVSPVTVADACAP